MDPSLLNGSSYVQYGMPTSYNGSSSNNNSSSSTSTSQMFNGNNTNNSSTPEHNTGDPSSSSSPGGTPNISLILTIRLLMQGKEVGSIIGKRGDQVKRIREESGAKINISDGSCPERIVTITGSLTTINKAFEMICSKFEEDMLALPNSVPKPPITMRLIVPATQCGSLIGKGGSKIKEIREATGASIQVASEMLPQSTERAVTISGTSDAINQCIAEVCKILLEAPPKGATLPFRPKPTFNTAQIQSAAQQAAQQQQLAAFFPAALLQQNAMAQLGLFPQELARGLQPTAYGTSFLSPATSLNPQGQIVDYNMLAGNGLILGGIQDLHKQAAAAAAGSQAAAQAHWGEEKQMELINQYAAINNSVLMGAPLLKGASPPGSNAHKPSTGTRFTPY